MKHEVITITRDDAWFAARLDYQIFIDGLFIDKIKNGEVKEIYIGKRDSHSTHSLQIVSPDCISNKLLFELMDLNNNFFIRCNIKGIKVLLIIFYLPYLILFRPSFNIISLERFKSSL